MSFTGNPEQFTVNAGHYTDPYEDFDHIYPQAVRNEAYALLVGLAVDAAGNQIDPSNVIVSGFDGDTDEASLAATDEYKLSIASAVPEGGVYHDEEHERYARGYGGDDSNEANLIERGIQELRDFKLSIARNLERGVGDREGLKAQLARVNDDIAALKASKTGAILPVYYASPAKSLLLPWAEDNPLAYARFDDDQTSRVAAYNEQTMLEAGIVIEEKSPFQLRIMATGAQIMKHCVSIVQINYTDK